MTKPTKKIKVLVIVGLTGSGKTELATNLAECLNGEIVNADSMQIYRGMDIGTAKPDRIHLARVPHHLVSIVSPSVNFTASDFRREAVAVIDDITGRGKKVIIAGGTGLYIRALLEGLVESPTCDATFRLEAEKLSGEELWLRLQDVDPDCAAVLHRNDRVRLIRALEVFHQTGQTVSSLRQAHGFSDNCYHALKIGIKMERKELFLRIDRRVDQMMEAGLASEVNDLLEAGFDPGLKSMRSIGYRHLCSFLNKDALTIEEAVRLIKRDTRRYAKRQATWFNADKDIYWLEYPDNFATILKHAIEFLA